MHSSRSPDLCGCNRFVTCTRYGCRPRQFAPARGSSNDSLSENGWPRALKRATSRQEVEVWGNGGVIGADQARFRRRLIMNPKHLQDFRRRTREQKLHPRSIVRRPTEILGVRVDVLHLPCFQVDTPNRLFFTSLAVDEVEHKFVGASTACFGTPS